MALATVPVVVAILKLIVAVIPTSYLTVVDKIKEPSEIGPIIAGNMTLLSMLMATLVESYVIMDTVGDAGWIWAEFFREVIVQETGSEGLVGTAAVASVSVSEPQG
jgi:hypothetical protein